MEGKHESYVVKVEGVQVFSADWVWQQMHAQSCRIDRAKNLAWGAVAVSVSSLIIQILLKAC